MFFQNTISIRKKKNLIAIDKCVSNEITKGDINFTAFDGFMSIANTIFYIYNVIIFVTNNNTIKIIYFVLSMHEGHHKC